MYESYWGLSSNPFTARGASAAFHSSPGHEEALSRLMYVVESQRRCGVLRGGQGTGKSTLLHVLARNARRIQRQVVLVDLWSRSGEELLWETTAGLGLAPRMTESSDRLWRRLQDSLQAQPVTQSPIVLLFDHVERAQPDAWSAIRRMFQLNPPHGCGVTFILAAGMERQGLVAGLLHDLSDLKIEISPLDREQTHEFVDSLLTSAGARRAIFTPDAIDLLFELSNGVPRDICRVCDLSLLAAMTCDETHVHASTVSAAAAELHLSRAAVTRRETVGTAAAV